MLRILINIPEDVRVLYMGINLSANKLSRSGVISISLLG